MAPIDFEQAKAEGKGFRFPADFEITAVGAAAADLAAHVPALLERTGLKVLHETVRFRHSSGGNFVSVTVTFHAPDRAAYDSAHAVLRADPAVRYTL